MPKDVRENIYTLCKSYKWCVPEINKVNIKSNPVSV